MTEPHKLFHARRKAPRDGGRLSRSGFFTKKAAEARRWDLAAFVLQTIPVVDLMACMTAPRPPSIGNSSASRGNAPPKLRGRVHVATNPSH